jgi:hypothetical protein
MFIVISFHAGRNLAALELDDPVKGTDFDITVANDENIGLLARDHIESLSA